LLASSSIGPAPKRDGETETRLGAIVAATERNDGCQPSPGLLRNAVLTVL